MLPAHSTVYSDTLYPEEQAIYPKCWWENGSVGEQKEGKNVLLAVDCVNHVVHITLEIPKKCK